jgi:hypothetical protein
MMEAEGTDAERVRVLAIGERWKLPEPQARLRPELAAAP